MKKFNIILPIVLAFGLMLAADYQTFSQNLTIQGVLTTKTDVWIPIYSTGASFNITNTAVETTAVSFTIPANSIGSNGMLRCTYLLSSPSVTLNNKICLLKLGGTVFRTNIINSATTISSSAQAILINRNDPAVQIAAAPASVGSYGVQTTAKGTFTINTAANQTFLVTLTNAVSTDSLTLEYFFAEVLKTN